MESHADRKSFRLCLRLGKVNKAPPAPTGGNPWLLNRKQVSRGCCPTTDTTGGHYRRDCYPYAVGTEVVWRQFANFVTHLGEAFYRYYQITASLANQITCQANFATTSSDLRWVYRWSMDRVLCPMTMPTSMGFNPFSNRRETASWH